jgi:hypothetical protein
MPVELWRTALKNWFDGIRKGTRLDTTKSAPPENSKNRTA